MDPNSLIFIYGSLRQGFANHYKISGAKYIGLYSTVKPMCMIGLKSGAYPLVIRNPPISDIEKVPIIGELYSVSPEMLNYLDKLEGEGQPDSYKRVIIKCKNDKNVEQDANIYIIEDEQVIKDISMMFNRRFVAINNGDWSYYPKAV